MSRLIHHVAEQQFDRQTFLVCLLLGVWPSFAFGQLAPEIGYVYPSGAQAGATVNVILGGYDWTPDMQVFVHDPRVKLEIIGPPSGVLITEPPYWFGYKARGLAWPLAREFPARLTIPADVPPGLIRWQVANANGVSPVGTIAVGRAIEVVEDAKRKSAQVLPVLPVTVSGQIRRIEEIDRYQFQVPKTGPVTIELVARQLGSPLHGMLQVRDPSGRVLLDAADSEGRDLTLTMIAQPGVNYELSLHDLDFAGDRSYVYRLTLTAGPNISAAYPAGGRRGETRPIEFVGIGLATGTDKLESITRDVAFPAVVDAPSFDYVLDTSFGPARPFKLLVSDVAEVVRPGAELLALTLNDKLKTAVTGSFDKRFGSAEFSVPLTKGQKLQLVAQSRAIASPLDLELALFGPDGKQIMANDDVPGTTDPELNVVVAVDGLHRIIVSDQSGHSGTRTANFRLSIEPPREDFAISIPALLPIPLGTVGKLAVKATRIDAFKGPITLKLTDLPEGVTAPADLTIVESKVDLPVDLTSAADGPAKASLCTLTATAQIGDQTVTRSAKVLIASIMKPRIKLTPEGLDDVRKVHRGSTYLFPMLISRLEGFVGEITLEMTAKQQRHRQGLASDEFLVPADATRVEYPIFVPEWMETTKTSRMILNGAVRVADPKGNMRTLLQRQELRFGILPEGALMKLSHAIGEPTVKPGQELRIPLTISRASELREPLRIELITDDSPIAATAEPLALAENQAQAEFVVRIADRPDLRGEQTLKIRATAKQHGRWPVVSETTVLITVRPE